MGCRANVITLIVQEIWQYPLQWWAEAPRKGAPAWEILPQEAGPGEVILSKRNELGVLSNFAATWEKVRQNPDVKKVLLSTGDLVLRPDHRQGPNAPAAWRYYDILTGIRTRLRGEKSGVRR